MADPITLSALGLVALTEGIKFLYGQAGEVLKRWRERKDAAESEPPQHLTQAEPIEVNLPPIFEGQLIAPQIHFTAVEKVAEPLRELRRDISDYADELEAVNVTDEGLLRKIDALRQLLEAVYQQHLTFKGEQRPPSGPLVKGQINVDEIAGYASAVHAGVITSGEVSGHLTVKRIEEGGQAFGVDVDKIGG